MFTKHLFLSSSCWNISMVENAGIRSNFFAAKQTYNKEKKKFNQQIIMVPDEFITDSLYRTSMLLLRILGRLNCDFMCILKPYTFNLYINSVREKY